MVVIDLDSFGPGFCRYMSKEGPKVPSRPFDNPNAGRIAISPLPSSYQMSSTALPMLRPRVFSSREMSPEAEWPTEAVVEFRVLGRGVAWALAIEGTAAIAGYVLWHLFTLLR